MTAAHSPNLASDLRLARQLADVADAISLDRFRAVDLDVSMKPDMTQVTDADRAVEAALREELQRERPADSILGEEYGSLGASSRQWIIDPIDGTANFVRGVPVWATLIAMAVDGVPVVGVVSSPALGKRWWAAQGLGAFTSDPGTEVERDISVSEVGDLTHASVACSGLDRFETAGRLEQYLALTRRAWRTRDYGDAWPYMMVAEGLVDVAGEFGLQPYDMAALFPIVQEAGGTFTSMDGEDGPWHGSALATNGRLHPVVLSALAAGNAPGSPGAPSFDGGH